MAQELLKTGKHNVTAITRAGSQSKLPSGIATKDVDYDKPETLVEALKGQDALIITLSVIAPPDTQEKLIRAAGDAGVPWILPNGWSPDLSHEGLVRDVPLYGIHVAAHKLIKEIGKSSFVNLCCGFWYEWSLSIPDGFGFDVPKRQVTFFDEGQTKISISTWPQVGRGVAALLSLPIKAEGSGTGLEDLRNRIVFMNSFTVNQQEMFESVLRVTGTKASEWKVGKQDIVERYNDGAATMKKGDRRGFVRMMYSRVFYRDGNGDFESNRGTLNSVLGLPKEDLDTATKAAVERANATAGRYAGDDSAPTTQ